MTYQAPTLVESLYDKKRRAFGGLSGEISADGKFSFIFTGKQYTPEKQICVGEYLILFEDLPDFLPRKISITPSGMLHGLCFDSIYIYWIEGNHPRYKLFNPYNYVEVTIDPYGNFLYEKYYDQLNFRYIGNVKIDGIELRCAADYWYHVCRSDNKYWPINPEYALYYFNKPTENWIWTPEQYKKMVDFFEKLA